MPEQEVTAVKIGKRLNCSECGKTVMVAKVGDGATLVCCGTEMTQVGPRKLGSAD